MISTDQDTKSRIAGVVILSASQFCATQPYTDFNCPGIDWLHNSLTDSYMSVSFREKLVTISDDMFLDQVVKYISNKRP